METITLTNQKGGVAKTTTTWHLGVGLQKRGYKVLLVDLDPQGNLTLTAGVRFPDIKHTLYEVFKGEVSANDALINLSEGLDLLVAGIDLAAADRTFTQLGREKLLQKALKSLKGSYDYCVIDTPPSLGVLNENALTCSNKLIIPIQADVYSLQGISQLNGFIEDIKDNANANLEVAGCLMTRVDGRTNINDFMMEKFEAAADKIGTKLFKTQIRATVAVSEAALEQSNLFDSAKNSTAAQDYNSFIDEFLGV